MLEDVANLNKTYFIADGYEDDFMIGFILDKENITTFNKNIFIISFYNSYNVWIINET